MVDINDVIAIAKEAGSAIQEIYENVIDVVYKEDSSPLTQADLIANEIITTSLIRLTPAIPILSEESLDPKNISLAREINSHWLVDPLDGTKEFIKRNDQFTVNIALIRHGRPVCGVVYAPALKQLYYATCGRGAFKQDKTGRVTRISSNNKRDSGVLRVVVSHSHMNDATERYVNEVKKTQSKRMQLVPMGSSLKMCVVAEGDADIYPRLSPTMHWDTAAGDIIVSESGKNVLSYRDQSNLKYNTEDKVNPWFVVV